MKLIATIARIILGCVFVFFGLNVFLQFLHMPPPSGPAGQNPDQLLEKYCLSPKTKSLNGMPSAP